MKKILFICSILMSTMANAQAFKGISIESSSDYSTRKSHDYNVTYSTYRGTKNYITVDFVTYNDDFAFSLRNNGRIYNYLDDLNGYYFIGEESGYKSYKIYIRWDHGGEDWGIINYSERSDGRPKLKILKNGWKVYYPFIEQ